jgi:DNA-binding NarL/FixJ family response regulator
VATSEQLDDRPLEGELVTVAEAAGARLRAETDQDADAARLAAEALVSAASTAMAAGHSLTAIASAEAHGKETVRQALRGDALRLVESTGEQARAMRAEHYQAIARASRLGLAMREIAHAAGVAHGTIRAINNRLASGASPDLEMDPTEEGHSEGTGESVDAGA